LPAISKPGVRRAKALARGGGMLLQLVRSGFYHPRCRICGQELVQAQERIICENCREKIVPAAENRCRVCDAFVPDNVVTCGSCLLAAPPFLRQVSYAAYEGPLRQAIILYKYGEIEPLKHLLAQLCLEVVEQRLPGPFDAVVPVPADRGRRHGFQPVRAMAGVLANRLDVPFWPGLLTKKKRTPPQVGLSQAQRLANLDGAFALAAGKKVAGMSILLIDDVSTTGTTLRQCAAVLKKGGAEVTALTLARSRL
jgi:competence protein ComFC